MIEEVIGEDGDSLWGQCKHSTLEFEIKNGLPAIHHTTTLLHEIMHAALAKCGIMEHDELHVNALSITLVEIFRDNPDLVRYLTDGG